MSSRTWSRSPIALGLAVAVLSFYSMVAFAQTPENQARPSGELTASGEVTVDGARAISGATIFSDSTISTAQNSSAIISLGQLGRVELLPGSTLRLSFTDNGLNGSLEAGRVRVSKMQNASANITTRDASAAATTPETAMFTVDVECGNTFVSTQTGRVEVRTANETRQIAAGQDTMAGQMQPGVRCSRLEREGMRGIGGGALAGLLLAAAGAIAAAIYATTRGSDIEVGAPGGTPISPSAS